MANAPVPDFLTAAEAADIKSALGGLINDAQLNIAIVYQKVSREEQYDPITGTHSPIVTAVNANALKASLSLREIQNSNGFLQVGDQRIWVATSDVAGSLSRNDRVVMDGDTYMILQIKEDPIRAVWNLTIRKL